MKGCVFCDIISGESRCEKVFENDDVFAFNDANPVAPVHILVVSKEHIRSIADIDSSNSRVMAALFEAIAEIAKEQGLKDGFRVVSNVGGNAGQTVSHLHMHLIGGHMLSMKLG